MLNLSQTNSPRIGRRINDAPEATICMISIGRGTNNAATGIRVFPTRESDWRIFYPRPSAVPSASIPREVFWVASNLLPGETLLIQPKDPDFGVFNYPSFEITHPANGVASGPVIDSAIRLAGGRTMRWPYAIILSHKGVETSHIDPVIIIEPDP